MTDGEDPTYLDTPPEIAPEPPSTPTLAVPPGQGVYRTPDPPREVPEKPRVRVRMPDDEPELPREPIVEAPPGFLAQLLGPLRTPRIVRAYPRACGILLAVIGGVCLFDLHQLQKPIVAEPYVAGASLVFAAWLIGAGRPADEHGYAPAWWNRGVILMVPLALFAGLVLDTFYL